MAVAGTPTPAWVTQAREQYGLAPAFQAEVEALARRVVAEQLATGVLEHLHAAEAASEA